MLKNKWTFLLINIVGVTVLFLLFASEYTLLHYINSLFYISFIYVMLFLVMYTTKGGFFDGVTFGFRRFHHVVIKREDYLEEWREKPLPSEKVATHLYPLIKFQSFSLFFCLLGLLIIYYLFS
ncbi:DUF3899 domain-containing protein [Bacillus sp. B15-48]|uniref:DUF3899 domain-containing protein n=1 Tax=Bacillus sp. B15-48 TaxID=1548601 RepID=UPI00193FEC39|nr:DUF3899 domain-containing protein [Bacillus sp. B15-48]MBM4761645.1 DUF3899 domain-containing protein [Bacillus sp. B15-48]